MSLAAILSAASGLKGFYDQLQTKQDIDAQRAKLRGEQSEAERAAQSILSSLRTDPTFRVQEAPTRSADTAINLAEQGIDSARDRALSGLSSLVVGSDPRFAGANVQRAIRAYDERIADAEQRGAQTTTAAVKAIDDAKYAAQEMERKRQEGLKQFELQQAVQGLQQAGEGASAYDALSIQQQGQNAQDFLSLAGNLANLAKKAGPETVNNYYVSEDDQKSTESQGDNQSTESTVGAETRSTEEQTQENQTLQTQLDGEPDVDLSTDTSEETQPVEDDLGVTIADVDESIERDRNAELAELLASGGPVDENPAPDFEAGPPPSSVVLASNPTFRDDDFEVNSFRGNRDLRDILNLPSTSPFVGNTSALLSALRNFEMEDGGTFRGMVTEGEFDHDTNKKALIDEESGRKEAELTGGEAVFSEEDLGDMVAFVKEGDEEGLLSWLKSKLQEPQFGYEFA